MKAQYKCKYVFPFWHKLAMLQQKCIILYYGIQGHGKGLVDAMSFFWVKRPLKHSILTDDKWFSSPEEMVSYLQGLQTDNDMHCSLVDKSQLLKKREYRENMIKNIVTYWSTWLPFIVMEL